MELYHTSFASLPDGVCSHYGTLAHGVNLLDGMFAAKTRRGFDGHAVTVFASEFKGHRAEGEYSPDRIETPVETLRAFAEFAGMAKIYRLDVTVSNSLRLNDCWGDDPIGSGGPTIFTGNTALTATQRKELDALFYPFVDIIYPWDVQSAFAPKDITRMKREVLANGFFGDKLRSRREKLGGAYPIEEPSEVVWMYLTMQLRNWSLKNGYDSFCYHNHSEGPGDDSIVTLKKGSAKILDTLKLDMEAFFAAGAPLIERHMKKIYQDSIFKTNTPRMNFCDVVDMTQFMKSFSANVLGLQSPVANLQGLSYPQTY